MEVMSDLSNGQIVGDGVVQRNGDEVAIESHLDVLLLRWNTEFLGLLIDVALDVFRGFLGIGGGCEARFGGDGVLQLVIREPRRHDFNGAENHRPQNDDGYSEAKLRPAPLAVLNSLRTQSEEPSREQFRQC